MKTFLTLTLAAMLGSLTVPNSASANEVNHRLNNEQARINNGVATGRLGPQQANRLERGEQHIQRQESRDLARNGGRLTWRERLHLNHEENRLSHGINRSEAHRNMGFHRWSRGR